MPRPAADDLITDISFGPDLEETCVFVHDEAGNNLVAFRSGGGDGRQGTWAGYSADGEVACFGTDFAPLTHDRQRGGLVARFGPAGVLVENSGTTGLCGSRTLTSERTAVGVHRMALTKTATPRLSALC